MRWLYNNKPLETVPEWVFGFVYRITNTETGRMYIGKKQFKTIRRVRSAKKTRATVKRKESDWKTYTGSCVELNEDIARIGAGKFKFEILIIVETKGQLSYAEEAAHYKYHVLLDDRYYNNSVGPGRMRSVRRDPDFITAIRGI